MNLILFLFIILLLAVLIYLSRIDGNYSVSRSQVMRCDRDKLFRKLCDFKSWPDWSPWLIHEPDARLTYSDNYTAEGGFYRWDGKHVGAGTLTHVTLDRPEQIQQKLEFTRPFKSVCSISFTLRETEGATEVTWTMQGHMPFFLRFMIARMQKMIGNDYELGLAMLAGQMDASAESPTIVFQGRQQLSPQPCLCKSFSGFLPDMQQAMQQGFPELQSHIEQQGKSITGAPCSVYHKVDVNKMHFVCDMAVPVAQDINAGDYELKSVGDGKYFKTLLKGNYRYLELAWYSAYAHLQMLGIKADKTRSSIEVYENDPQACEHPNEWLTGIYIPIK